MAFDPIWSPAGNYASASWGQGAVWRTSGGATGGVSLGGVPLTNSQVNVGQVLQRAGILPKAPIDHAASVYQAGTSTQLLSGGASSTGLLISQATLSYNAQGRIQTRTTPGSYVSVYA